MAENTDHPNDQENGKKGPGKFGTVLIVCMLAAIGYGLISDDDDPSPQSASEGTEFDLEEARLEEEEQRQMREEIAARQSGRSTDDGELDPFAAMSAMTRRQEMLEQKLEEVTDELEEAQGSAEQLDELADRSERLEGQLRDLTQMLKDDAEAQRLADRQDAAELNRGESSDLAFDLEGGLSEEELSDDEGTSSAPRNQAPRPRSPYGENYIVLGGGGGNPILSDNDPFRPTSNGSSNDSGGLFQPPEGASASNPFSDDQPAVSGGQQRVSRARSTGTNGVPPEYGDRVQPGYAGSDRASAVDDAVEDSEGDSDSTIKVPAFAFVDAKTLHGLDCPIGAELPRSAEGQAGGVTPGRAQPMPVVLPLMGKIRGPNGNVTNLGTAHVMGWCIGRRVDRGESGRALIKVEAISYWDQKGDPQYLNSISGDVISLTDNHRGIQAPVDEVRRSYLGEQAGAAALAAAAAQLNQNQYEETRNPEGGVDRVFSGDRGVALGAQGSAAAFTQVAELINEEAEMAYDTVRVPSGAPVRVLFMAPFEVTNTKLEVEDEILDAYDVLI